LVPTLIKALKREGVGDILDPFSLIEKRRLAA
jgi:hypothetical protein